MKQLLTYGIVNGLFVAMIYCGLFLGMEGPLNIAVAIGWMTVALTPFILSKSVESTLRDSPAWKRYVDLPFDVIVAVVFMWHGYLWLGALYMLHQLILFGVWRSATTAPE